MADHETQADVLEADRPAGEGGEHDERLTLAPSVRRHPSGSGRREETARTRSPGAGRPKIRRGRPGMASRSSPFRYETDDGQGMSNPRMVA